MSTDKKVLRYIISSCKVLKHGFCQLIYEVWDKKKMKNGIPVVPHRKQIKYLKECLETKVESDAISGEITVGELRTFYSFMKKEESNRFLAHVLKKLRPAILKYQLKKAEESKLEMEESLTYSRTRVQAYGEGFAIANVPDEQLQAIGMMLGVATRRWKEETVKREVDEQLNKNEHMLCPITRAVFFDPVVASDGHTYERCAIETWLHKHKTSPVTRKPISILRDNDGLKSLIASTRELLQEQIYAKCELPKLE